VHTVRSTILCLPILHREGHQDDRDVRRVCRARRAGRNDAPWECDGPQGATDNVRSGSTIWCEERRLSTISAGAGGVVAVMVRVLGG